MKIELEELLAHSFVLTIDDKRFQTFKKVFEHHNLNPIPKKWTGHSEWWNSPIYNCYLSHKDIVEHARKSNWDFVCVFEDDAWPINGVMDKLKSLLTNVPDNCQSLLLGHICNWKNNGVSGEFINGFLGYGTHAYVVFKEGYDKFIQTLDKLKVADSPFWAIQDALMDRDCVLASKENLFIQYNQNSSMNNGSGFTWFTKFRNNNGIIYIDSNTDNITPDEVKEHGFPMPKDVLV